MPRNHPRCGMPERKCFPYPLHWTLARSRRLPPPRYQVPRLAQAEAVLEGTLEAHQEDWMVVAEASRPVFRHGQTYWREEDLPEHRPSHRDFALAIGPSQAAHRRVRDTLAQACFAYPPCPLHCARTLSERRRYT